MSEERKSVPEKLRFYREACELSQKQVADALNIDRTTYTKYETGVSEPGLHAIVKIAKIFNVTPLALMPCTEEVVVGSTDNLRPDSAIFQLKKDERKLVALYRALEEGDKKRLTDIIFDMLKNN